MLDMPEPASRNRSTSLHPLSFSAALERGGASWYYGNALA